MNEEDYTPTIPRIFNRHIARTCGNLEKIKCPEDYKKLVRNAMYSIRDVIFEEEDDLDADFIHDVVEESSVELVAKLEEINCAEGYLEIIRDKFVYLRNDLISFAEMESAGNY